MKHRVVRSSNKLSLPSLRPWFLAPFGAPNTTRCCCRCAWTEVLSALQGAGPVALVLPGPVAAGEAASLLAAGLALGSDWTLQATVKCTGIEESLRWNGIGGPMEVHALPSSNWRPFDQLARQHRCADTPLTSPRSTLNAFAIPLLVDACFRMHLLAWSRLTRLDQEHGQEWMNHRRLQPLLL
jgi:hypothetical protein